MRGSRWRALVGPAALAAFSLPVPMASMSLPSRVAPVSQPSPGYSTGGGLPANLTTLVNPLAGSMGSGFPMVGATVPFGMVEPGPDTMFPGTADPANYDGYAWQDSMIRGFSMTHFNGAGVPIAGDVPFLPFTGDLTGSDPSQYASPFSHATEVAHPGYYAVTLNRYATRVEITATTRVAMFRITYPPAAQPGMLVDASRSISGMHPASVDITGPQTMTVAMRSTNGYPLYVDALFSHPFTKVGTWNGSILQPDTTQASGGAVGGYVGFAAGIDRTLIVRIGISYVDPANAALNLATEIPSGRSFDSVRRAAQQEWNSHLHDIAAAGGSLSNERTFYTSLYRSMLMPSIFDDVNGQYLGFDDQVHQVARGHHHYTSLSLWDTYRSLTPLLTLIEPKVAHDIGVSLLADAAQNHGVIPRWVQANLDTGGMSVDSGSVTLAELVMSGMLTGSDATTAYHLMYQQATTLPPVSSRPDLNWYLADGYVPNDVNNIGTSITLEYGVEDAAIAQVANLLGHPAAAAALDRRAGYWRNVFDPSVHFIRPRNADGSWASPTRVGPISTWSPDFQDGYQEATGWQDLWLVPQDVAGLSAAIGGTSATVRRLDTFFSAALNQPGNTVVPESQAAASGFGIYYAGNQYTSANEPDLWAPWYYDWLGQPWKSQQIVRAEMSSYNDTPFFGLPGDDDTGELSAWYVLAALGMYRVTPGVPVWELNSPAFPSIAIRLPVTGGVLHEESPGASTDTVYVHALTLDGRPVNRTYLTSCELTAGATLDFTLGVMPDRSWAAGPGAAPPSLSDHAASPVVRHCLGQMAHSPPSP